MEQPSYRMPSELKKDRQVLEKELTSLLKIANNFAFDLNCLYKIFYENGRLKDDAVAINNSTDYTLRALSKYKEMVEKKLIKEAILPRITQVRRDLDENVDPMERRGVDTRYSQFYQGLYYPPQTRAKLEESFKALKSEFPQFKDIIKKDLKGFRKRLKKDGYDNEYVYFFRASLDTLTKLEYWLRMILKEELEINPLCQKLGYPSIGEGVTTADIVYGDTYPEVLFYAAAEKIKDWIIPRYDCWWRFKSIFDKDVLRCIDTFRSLYKIGVEAELDMQSDFLGEINDYIKALEILHNENAITIMALEGDLIKDKDENKELYEFLWGVKNSSVTVKKSLRFDESQKLRISKDKIEFCGLLIGDRTEYASFSSMYKGIKSYIEIPPLSEEDRWTYYEDLAKKKIEQSEKIEKDFDDAVNLISTAIDATLRTPHRAPSAEIENIKFYAKQLQAQRDIAVWMFANLYKEQKIVQRIIDMNKELFSIKSYFEPICSGKGNILEIADPERTKDMLVEVYKEDGKPTTAFQKNWNRSMIALLHNPEDKKNF